MSKMKFSERGFKRMIDSIRKTEQGRLLGKRPGGQPVINIRWTAHGVLDEELTQGGTATLSLWRWDGTEEVDTGENIEVGDWVLDTGDTLAAETHCFCVWDTASSKYYVVIGGGSGDGRLKVSDDDELDFLEDQLEDYVAGSGQAIGITWQKHTVGDAITMQGYIDTSNVADFDITKTQALIHVTGTLTWAQVLSCSDPS